MSEESPQPTSGYFCIDTVFQGPVSTMFNENDKLCIFATQAEAQREIVENAIIRLRRSKFDVERSPSATRALRSRGVVQI